MSEQTSTFNTAHVLDNEIVKASDFEFAFESLVNNVAKSTQMILESTQDFVINGKVVPSSGMTVNVSPIFGVCKTTGTPFGRTETHPLGLSFEIAESGRIDIIEVQGAWKEYDTQQRAFNDPDTNTQTYQYVETKKLAYPNYRIKQGVAGSGVAPEHDAGWVKLAEIVLRPGASSILESDIKNITSDVAGLANTDWTYEEDVTYNIGYISDVNARFRVAHNEDGTHKEDCIDLTMLDVGIGTGQVNGNVLPVGATVNIPNQTVSANDSILSVLTKTAAIITTLYNAYLQYDGAYKFNGDVSVSDIADPDTKVLTNPIVLHAEGDGTAQIKIGANAVISIDANGKLSTNGYQATANNHIITKAVTDAISSALTSLTTRVSNLENTNDNTVYSNGVLSSGTDGRYNLAADTIALASTQNLTLSGTQTVDNRTPSDGDLILVKNQTDAKENGIWQYSSGSNWSRSASYDVLSEVKGKIFNVIGGDTQAGKMFYIPKVNFTATDDQFGVDDINFLEYFGSIKVVANKLVMRDSNGNVTGNITGNVTGNCSGSSGSCTGNAATATKLAATKNINGTAFDGSENITTSSWGTARDIKIQDSDGSNTGSAVSVDGSAAKTLKLPATIKAALTGTALGANSTGILTCGTAAGTAAKTISLTGFSLTTGVHLLIKFSNANSAANPTLNINSTGAKVITIGSGATSITPAAASSTSSAWNGIAANVVYDAYYDGTYWRLSKLDGNISGIKAHYFSTTGGYIVYTNGLIVQWLICTASTPTTNADFNLLVSFTSSYMAYLSLNTSTNNTESFEFRHLSVVTSNLSKVRLVRASTIPRFVLCIGY